MNNFPILIWLVIFSNIFVLISNHKCTNEWIVKIEEVSKVDAIANATGFLNKGQVILILLY